MSAGHVAPDAMRPTISVLLPVFAEEAFLGDALSSVLGQSFRDFEVVAVCEPRTSGACRDILVAAGDRRIRIIEAGRPLTVGGALNFGLANARGEFIARMDGDDVCLPERFVRQLEWMLANPAAALCGSWCEVFGDENWELRIPDDDAELKFSLVFGCPYVHPTVMWRRDAFAHAGLQYDESLPATEDYDLWLRAADHVRFGAVQEVLLRYRKHAATATHRNAETGRQIYRDLQRRALRRYGIEADEATLAFHYLTSTVGLQDWSEWRCLRDWLHCLWLRDEAQPLAERQAIGRVCARRWFDACSAVEARESYAAFRTSALVALLSAAEVEKYARIALGEIEVYCPGPLRPERRRAE
jgi:hypothetical protein